MKLNFILKTYKFIFLLFILILIFKYTNNLDFKKNKNIKISEKQDQGRVLEIQDESIVENKINLKKSNFLIIFYANWCLHW